jgi:hypothetical protein
MRHGEGRMIEPEDILHVFHEGRAASLRPARKHAASAFGGPLELDVVGLALERPLHHIATIAHVHLRDLGVPWRFSGLPLAFGLTHSGCELRYSFESDALVVDSLEPRAPTPDWPYAAYPALLPYVPLEATPVEARSWDEFRRLAPNLPAAPTAELIVLAPPPATLGFSMWGRQGDAEGVTIVFECSIDAQRVEARTLCA